MGNESQRRSLLTILLATCEVTRESAIREGTGLSPAFLAALEQFIELTRRELDALADE